MDPLLTVSILGGILAVFYRSSLRVMISQPICSGLIVGLLLGSAQEGFLAGSVFQMIFLGLPAIRGEHLPDITLGGVAAASIYILTLRQPGCGEGAVGVVFAGSILSGILVSAAGRYFYVAWGRWSGALAERVLEMIKNGDLRSASAVHLSMLLVHLVFGAALVAGAVLAGRGLITYITLHSGSMPAGALASIHLLLPSMGIGSLLRLYHTKSQLFWFAAGFLLFSVIMIFRG